MSDPARYSRRACTGTDRHDGSIKEQRVLLTLDQVKGSNKGTGMGGSSGLMDIAWLHICMRKERHSAAGKGRERKGGQPRFKDIFSSRDHRAGPFSRPRYMCVFLCVCGRVLVFYLEVSWFWGALAFFFLFLASCIICSFGLTQMT